MRSERLNVIAEMLAVEGSVSVEQLVEELTISPATARRDLDALEEQGVARRTRGGALRATPVYDAAPKLRSTEQAAEKNLIARHCLSYLHPGIVVGLSGGSTVGTLAGAITTWASEQQQADAHPSQPMVTVVTNAVDIAYALANAVNMKIVLIGGVLNGTSYELTGPFTQAILNQLSIDIAFLGANGIDENGPGTVDEFEASTNRLMSTRADKTIIVADHTKFGRRSFSTLGGVETVDAIVTDSGVDEKWRDIVTRRGYTVISVDAEGHTAHTGERK